MKNEKREITLNEKDSIRDMLETEKGLSLAYTDALWQAERREVRHRVLEHIPAVAEDIFLLADLFKGGSGE